MFFTTKNKLKAIPDIILDGKMLAVLLKSETK